MKPLSAQPKHFVVQSDVNFRVKASVPGQDADSPSPIRPNYSKQPQKSPAAITDENYY